MILAEPAAYLECRYDRAMALRAIVRRHTHDLYGQSTPPKPGPARDRVEKRLQRACHHLTILTGDGA
ncbi:hypothetical protein HFP72_06825 [Nocardiopsis sp. ARC36]